MRHQTVHGGISEIRGRVSNEWKKCADGAWTCSMSQGKYCRLHDQVIEVSQGVQQRIN
jgi:hypothetical protein